MHMKKVVFGIALLISMVWVQAAPHDVIDITSYGAVEKRGKTLNSTAIQKAIDECHHQGGGKVNCFRQELALGHYYIKRSGHTSV